MQNKQVNAFATPNGIVVVNSGLIEMLENEAQLAAIVGHEVVARDPRTYMAAAAVSQEGPNRDRAGWGCRERLRPGQFG